MKCNVEETEEVWKSLEEKERAEEEREGGERDEEGGMVLEWFDGGWRDEADFWPGKLL